jgi:hypothetical protein
VEETGWQRIGSDRVRQLGEGGLLVDAAAEMPDWQARDFRRLAVLFEGERFFVASNEQQGARFRYRLEPWVEDLRDIAAGVIDYDEAFVAERDEHRAHLASARSSRRLLLPFYPLIGFLPGSVKIWLADRYGVSEDLSSRLSMWLEALLVLLSATFWSVRTGAGAFGGAFGASGSVGEFGFRGAEIPIILLATPDLAIRWSRIFGESDYPWGFWEWLWKREPRDEAASLREEAVSLRDKIDRPLDDVDDVDDD